MRRYSALLPFIGLVVLFCASCMGGDRPPRQEPDAPRYGTYPSGSDPRYQKYGPQDRAGKATQSGSPTHAGCQRSTPC